MTRFNWNHSKTLSRLKDTSKLKSKLFPFFKIETKKTKNKNRALATWPTTIGLKDGRYVTKLRSGNT